MQIIHTIAELRAALAGQRSAFVPTMGNLHDGHLRLIARAMAGKTAGQVDRVVASIFVNRLQFLPHEDFDAYPRTLADDAAKLQAAGCDIVFAPTESELYPEVQGYRVLPPAGMADALEGAFRPGFFTGVCTVVSKLFHIVQPDIAVFGQKDYQQLAVIRAMVRQMAMPIQIVGVPTERAADGLALSSRNGYLSPAERTAALALKHSLEGLVAAVQAGRRDWAALEQAACASLDAQGWQTDYLTVRLADSLQTPDGSAELAPLVALGASRLGNTRLIDNIEFRADQGSRIHQKTS